MIPQEPTKPPLTIPEFAARIKSKHPEYAEVPDEELTDRVLKKHPEYSSRVQTVSRPRNQAQAEADAANARTQFEQAQSAFQSASGQKLNPPVDSTAPSYYRPLTASEQEARKRGEPVIISEAAQQSPVAPELTSRPRTVTNAAVSLDPVIQGRLEQIEREKRQRDTQRKVEQARQVMQRRQPSGLLLPAGQRNAGSNFKPTFAGTGGRVIPPQSNIPTAADFAAWGASPSSEPQTFAEDRERRRKLSGVGELRKQDDPLAAREIRVQKHIQDQVVKDVAGSQENFARVKADYEKLGRGAEFQQKVEQATATKLNDFRQREAQVGLAEQGKLAPLGLMDKISEIGDKPSQLVPFLASAVNIHELLALGSAAGRLEDGKATELDLLRLREFNAAAQRDSTFMYKVANVVSGLPSFVGEIALTGGLYTLGKEAALKGLQRLATKQGLAAIEKRLVGRLAVKSVASLAGSALQTLPASATRIPEGVLFRERGGADFSNALRDTLTDQFIEIASERAGGLLTEIPLPKKLSAIRDAITARWVSKIPGRTADQLQKLVEKTGWHGPIGEIFEERFGDAAKYGVGLQSSPIPSLEQLAVEGLAFSVPGGVEAVANKMLRTKMPASQTLIDYAINSPLTTAEDKAKIEKLVESGVASTEDVQAILSGETIPDQKPEARAANPSEVSPVIENAQQSALDQSTEARGPSSTPPTVESKEVKPESRPKGSVSSSEASSPGILENITEVITTPESASEVPNKIDTIPTPETVADVSETRPPIFVTNTAREIERAVTFSNKPHIVGEALALSPLRDAVLRALPEGAKLYGPNAEAPEMQSGSIRLRAPDGGIWEVDLAYNHRHDAGWQMIGTWQDGFAIHNTGQAQPLKQSQGQPAVTPPTEVKTQPSATESQLTTVEIGGKRYAQDNLGDWYDENDHKVTEPQRLRAIEVEQLTTAKEVTNESAEPSVGGEAVELTMLAAPGRATAPDKFVAEKDDINEEPKSGNGPQTPGERTAKPPSKPTNAAQKLQDWGSRLKTIAQSKNLDELQALSDEMAAHKDDPRVARLRQSIQEQIDRARLPESDQLFSRAFHGSPHAFDRFSTEKIGTGEGAQSEGNRVSLNQQGAKLLDEAFRESGRIAKNDPGIVRGAFEKHPSSLVAALDKMAKAGREGAADLADTIHRAAREGSGKVVLFYGENARKHELFHEASDRAKRFMDDRHADLPSLINSDAFRKMSDRLIAIGYPGTNLPVLVEEAAAHLAEGKYELLGITRDEAVEWMFKWFKSFEQKNPHVTPRQFQEMSNEATEARDKVYATESRVSQPQSDQTLPRLQAGRTQGAGASLARTSDITQTESFRNWFKESKVVDKKGEPLIVYHGTRSSLDFDAFDTPAHFGTPVQANEIVTGAKIYSTTRSVGPRIIPVYLSIKNPKRVPDVGGANNEWEAEVEQAEAEGYDGLVYRNDAEGRKRSDSWVAFYPSQIKSATGNVGTFDPNDPNILMARSDDPWADLMELSDEFGRLANEPELAEGEKETKQSRLAAGVEAKAIEAKLTAGFQGLPEYETVKVADQARMAADLLRNDPQEARRVALGQSVPPGNLLPESVFVALENQALQQRDVGLLRELATISTLSAEATGMGQRIRMLAERNPYSPVTAMREIQTAREARAKKKMGPKFRERVITEIKTEVRKSAPKAKDWKSFLEEIKCK